MLLLMDQVKFGIVGTGGAWGFHSTAFKDNPKITLTAVYDVDEKRAKKTAKRFQAQAVDSYQKLLESEIDAVLIMVPHYLHEEYVIAAAKAGKHILCEKPMATTLEGCDLMIDATEDAGVKFMIAENHRFLPAHKYIRDIVQKGLIGDVFLIRSYEGVNEISGLMKEGFWKGHPIKAGGGSLMDMGAHKFATMNWILNDSVESAYAWITKQCTTIEEKAEDNAMMFLKFKSGIIGETLVSFTVVTTPTNTLEIYGTKGTIIENHAWQNPVRINSYHKDMGENKGRWVEPEIEHGPYPIYYNISARIEDTYFAECIIEDKEPEFTPYDAREAIETVLMGYLSARLKKEVNNSDLRDVYNNLGTKTILDGLEKYVKNNYCK